jgi:choline monooxygenase
VFVNLDPAAAPLETFTAGIAERIAPMRLDALRFSREVRYEVRANWKVYVDNYLEGYHVPYVHPELVKLYDYQQYVTEVFEWYSLQYSPLTGENTLYAPDGGGDAFYYCLFPNFMLNILPGRLQTNHVRALAHDRCEVVFRYFHADVDSPAARAFSISSRAVPHGSRSRRSSRARCDDSVVVSSPAPTAARRAG